MKRIERRNRRSESEIRDLVDGYEKGNQPRVDYCAANGLAPSTLDYYRRRLRSGSASLVEIDLQSPAPANESSRAVTVVLRNGRRVEIGWSDLPSAGEHRRPLGALLSWLEEA